MRTGQKENNCGIYRIVNKLNGKKYIGSAINIHARWRWHRAQLIRGIHHSSRLQNAWNKYGEENFVFEIILCCGNSDLICFEQQFIDSQCPEYNICRVAGSSLGRKHPESVLMKMAESQRERYKDPATRVKLSVAQKKRWAENPEARARQGSFIKGKKMSLEQRGKISAAKLVISEETREKLRIAATKKWSDPAYKDERKKACKILNNRPEFKLKLSLAAKKRPPKSAEVREKISKSLQGKTLSADVREKISRANSSYWAAPEKRAEQSLRASLQHAKRKGLVNA